MTAAERLPTQREAKELIRQFNQSDFADAFCSEWCCVLPPDHSGAHLTYEQLEAIALGRRECAS